MGSGSEETLGQTMKLFFFLTLSLLAPWSEGRFVKRSLASYELAKCNDGTPANYFYSDDLLDATKLVINLQGGGACYDKQGCQNRCKNGNILCTESPDEEKNLGKLCGALILRRTHLFMTLPRCLSTTARAISTLGHGKPRKKRATTSSTGGTSCRRWWRTSSCTRPTSKTSSSWC